MEVRADTWYHGSALFAPEGFLVSAFTTCAGPRLSFDAAARIVMRQLDSIRARHGFDDRDVRALKLVVHRMDHLESARDLVRALGVSRTQLTIVMLPCACPERSVTLTGYFIKRLDAAGIGTASADRKREIRYTPARARSG